MHDAVGALAEPSKHVRGRGLFESLIADPRVLFHGLLEDPESYEDGVSELLQNLVSGRAKREELTPQELQLLDRATLEFASAKRPKPPGGPPARAPQQQQQSKVTPPEEVELIYQEKGPPIPDMELPDSPPTNWWKK
jgi:hypothetical protein